MCLCHCLFQLTTLDVLPGCYCRVFLLMKSTTSLQISVGQTTLPSFNLVVLPMSIPSIFRVVDTAICHIFVFITTSTIWTIRGVIAVPTRPSQLYPLSSLYALECITITTDMLDLHLYSECAPHVIAVPTRPSFVIALCMKILSQTCVRHNIYRTISNLRYVIRMHHYRRVHDISIAVHLHGHLQPSPCHFMD